MVHVPAKFRENTTCFRVTVWKLNVTGGRTDRRTDRQTDRQTDGRGALQYLPSRAFGAAGDNKSLPHRRQPRHIETGGKWKYHKSCTMLMSGTVVMLKRETMHTIGLLSLVFSTNCDPHIKAVSQKKSNEGTQRKNLTNLVLTEYS